MISGAAGLTLRDQFAIFYRSGKEAKTGDGVLLPQVLILHVCVLVSFAATLNNEEIF
jgi:hypothetical protein